MSNKKTYGEALPFNTALYDPLEDQPRDEKKHDFLTFKPLSFIEYPILRPGQLNSFWTLMYAGMWYDTEPKFIAYTGPNDWWRMYFRWMNGRNQFPGDPVPGVRRSVMRIGSALEALGLIPVFLGLSGLFFMLRETLRGGGNRDLASTLLILLVLASFNAAVAVKLAIDVPVFSAMKSSYLLGALPAFCVFVGFGVQLWESHRGGKLFCGTLMGTLFLLAIIHVSQLTYYGAIRKHELGTRSVSQVIMLPVGRNAIG